MTLTQYRETNTLALAGQAMQLFDFGAMLVKSGMLPSSVRTPEAAVTIMVKGMELGLPAMAALNGITVIQGKPTVSPQLMLSLINRSGQLENIDIDTGAQGATVTMKRRGRSPFTARFGPAEAQAMGLNTKDNYKKQAPVMYQWRAVAACARVVFPDVIDGLYTPEEMGADVQVDEDGAMTVTAVQEAKPAPTQAERRQMDVTREVQQAAGLPERTTQAEQPQEAALQAWAVKIGEIADRVRQIAPPQSVADVQAVLDTYNWRSDVTAARACYDDLVTLGRKLAEAKEKSQASQQPKQDSDVVEAELLPASLTPGQLKALQQAAGNVGADTSEKRAAWWGYLLKRDQPLTTKQLNEDEAAHILDKVLASADHDTRLKWLNAALKQFGVQA